MGKNSALVFCYGAAMGALFMAGIAMLVHYSGNFECQQDLPRTQHCEKKWVAP